MYLYEIIIDGFKSYAQRTVVSGFDPQFNAITGLNGTGKSNILDSICFVLGISNLSQVRVGNLQELVYKQGQAGVTKATVTIVFDNSDPTTSPVAYESCKQITVTRQVVIGGKNKYMINGRSVQQSEVQNLFHSVQLNVNNPHFLIMQGRITKVLNMKPMEILGMIEEAAGTRMFETKKQAAIKTIEKKQLKVDELTKCMNEEITPTLESLRTERLQYQTWIGNNTEIEKLERFMIAYNFQITEEKVKSSENDKLAIMNELQSFQKVETDMNTQITEYNDKILSIEKQREIESEGPLMTLKKRENDLSKEIVKTTTLLNNQKELLNNEKENITNTNKQMETTKTILNKKQTQLNTYKTDLTRKETEVDNVEKQVIQLREQYQNACAGVADETNATLLSLPEQIVTWEKKIRETSSSLQQGKIRSEHMKTQLVDLKKLKTTQYNQQENTIKLIEQSKTKLHDIESQLKSLSFNETEDSKLRTESSQITHNMSNMKDEINTLSAQVEARLNFNYRDPERGFNRAAVKGVLGKLFQVKDTKTCTALEIVGGGKLYNIVVDNEHTAKSLLTNGGLKRRVTFLPLNKIDNRVLDKNKVQTAKDLAKKAGKNAYLALELITFDESVRAAMEYTFGNIIICDDAKIAQEIAFHPNVRTKTVTLEGDSYDPSGTLTGGSNNSIGSLLIKVQSLYNAQKSYHELDNRMKELHTIISKNDSILSQYKTLKSQLEIQNQTLAMNESRMNESSYGRTITEIESLGSQMKAIETESKQLQEANEVAKKELAKLQNTESNFKTKREKAIKDMENLMKSTQKQASALKTEFTNIKNKHDSLIAEITALELELSNFKEQISGYEQSLSKLTSEIDKLSNDVVTCREDYETAKTQLQSKQNELNACNKEIKTLEGLKEKCVKAAQTASLEGRKITHKLKQWEAESKEASKKVIVMLRQHPWIEKEKSFFGLPDSDFDFEHKDINASQKRLTNLKVEQDKLMKKINKKVMGMIEKAESEYKDLNQKREVILKDKAKIEAVIEELDIKKTQALQSTWTKVNRDFGSIFSMLLPGTTAKLEPPEGQTASEGLEVKVAFNGVWKDSLTELSGGQRSLLALSLILGLLLFKPAPMYILDEVDAALDLSHTQNIGLMLRTHFSTSQFIVVSLKEGMFNNANVIFRTKFVDGVSAVSRTVVNSRNKNAITNSANTTKENRGGAANVDSDEDDTEKPSNKKTKKITSGSASVSGKSNSIRNAIATPV